MTQNHRSIIDAAVRDQWNRLKQIKDRSRNMALGAIIMSDQFLQIYQPDKQTITSILKCSECGHFLNPR